MLQWWWTWRLHSEDPSTFNPAVRRLASYHNRRAAEALLPYLNSHERLPEVARALACIGDPLVVEPLVAVLGTQTPYWDDKVAAATALGRFRDPRATPVLVAHLRHASCEVRKAAADALSHCGWQPRDEKERAVFLVAQQYWGEVVELGQLAIEPLLFVWEHSFAWEHPGPAAALDAIVRIGSPAIESLIGLLRLEYSGLRHTRHADLVKALQQIGVTMAETLESPDQSARHRLILDVLRELLQNEHDDLRREAAQALGELRWSATDDAHRALLAYALGRWTEAVTLGVNSVSLLARIAGNEKIRLKDREEAIVHIGHSRELAAWKALENVAQIARVNHRGLEDMRKYVRTLLEVGEQILREVDQRIRQLRVCNRALHPSAPLGGWCNSTRW